MNNLNKDVYECSDDEIFNELAELFPVEKKEERALTPEEERIIAGFEEIQAFYDRSHRLPSAAATDIIERLLAIRLSTIQGKDKCREVLIGQDPDGLLNKEVPHTLNTEELSDDDLASLLGDDEKEKGNPLFQLKHVRSFEERTTPDEIAQRKPCRDFAKFKRLFDSVRIDLEQGTRRYYSLTGAENKKVEQGEFYLLDGQLAYIAEKGEVFRNDHGQEEARLRVTFNNATESNCLYCALFNDACMEIKEPKFQRKESLRPN